MSELPVNKEPEFSDHVSKINSYFSFLQEDLSFELRLNDWVSYEYTIIWKRENLEVCIRFSLGEDSIVWIENLDLPYDESKKLYNFDLVGKCDEISAREVRRRIEAGIGVCAT